MVAMTRVSVRIDPTIRDAARAALKPYGLTLSAYIRLVLTYVAHEGKLPCLVMSDEKNPTRRGK
jgi:addiction module RelB/DinJ family antitoxin